MPIQSNKISYKGENIYVGIDVHLKQWHVCVRTDFVSGRPFTQSPSASVLYDHLCRNYPDGVYHSAYEVGFCGFAPHFELEAAGIHNIVFNPADISDTQKERMRKSDSVDCAKICRNLQQGNLRALHVSSVSMLEDRALLQARQSLVKERIRTKQRIKSMLYYNGIRYPAEFADNRSHWSSAFVTWLESLYPLPCGGNRIKLSVLVDFLRFINTHIRSIDREISAAVRRRHDGIDRLLRSVPGIGALTSAKLCFIIGDIGRFPSSDHLAGYIGLVPDVRASADKENVIGVTFRGNRMLRSALVESSWRAIAADPALGHAFSEYRKAGKHPNVAIIRIARKLVNRIFFVLKSGKPYEKSVVR